MDLSENGKCLSTSLQYVESSHAPYQRIRFFLFFFGSKTLLIINFCRRTNTERGKSLVVEAFVVVFLFSFNNFIHFPTYAW
jgi:hypothetical protein